MLAGTPETEGPGSGRVIGANGATLDTCVRKTASPPGGMAPAVGVDPTEETMDTPNEPETGKK